MDHPNIAKVLDAGTTPAGRPYFVMELVSGVPITQYCDDNRLTPRQRLELFVIVCQAIQHAHQKGIIHRDIKPSNVMVTLYDGQPVPKVIDFGVAKATEQKLTERTLFTQHGTMIGTLEYMSPEQAEMSALGVDTRSDIFSLGVLLYELLTGGTPLSDKRIKEAAYAEILRMIKEEEPPKPSTRLSDSGEGLASISANRQMEPAKLTKLVRGELDWIVMKALEKDRSRRYETASGFAADVERYLQDEPVQACPPSSWYRFCKFARRNRLAFLTASVSAMVILLALIGLAVSNVLITQVKNEKIAALDQAKINEKAANTQKALAEQNARTAAEQSSIALANEKTAKANELLAGRRFYAAQMNLAMQAWQAGMLPRVLELLEGQRPGADQEDLRGFEWFYLWRLCNGGRRVSLRGHRPGQAITSVAFTPDGTMLASASFDGTVRLWEPATGQNRMVLRGDPKGVWEVAFSPDSKILASSGQDSQMTLILWDATTGKPLHRIAESVAGLAFSPDGQTLAAGAIGADGVHAVLWNVATGEERGKLTKAGLVVGFLPDGKTLVTATNRYQANSEVQFWNLETKTQQLSIPVPGFQIAALSRDGTRLATSSGRVKLWDTATGKEQFELSDLGNVRALAFAPDGKKLATGDELRTVLVWDIETGRRVGQEVLLDAVWGLAFSPDGETLASSTTGGAITLWDMTPAEELTTIPLPAEVRSLSFSMDGQTLIVGNEGPTKLIDVAAGKENAELPTVGVTATSADGNIMAGWGDQDSRIVWDARTRRQIASIPLPRVENSSRRLTLSPDGKTLATFYAWQSDNTVKLWDLATGQPRILTLETPQSNRNSVDCAAFSADGKLLAAGFQFQWITVWEVATGKVKLEISQRPSMMKVISLAFAPGDRALAVGTDVGTVTLWEVETGKRLASYKGHTNRVPSLAFSPDGRTLATAGADKTVRLWDVATGQERCALIGHQSGVHKVVFDPTGNTLASASNDGTVKLWRAATDSEALARRTRRETDDPYYNMASTSKWFAWQLSTAADPRERDPVKAVVLAKKAVALAPWAPSFWQTLAIAHYRAGAWQEALTALEKSQELARGQSTVLEQSLRLENGGDGFDWFFLAMAHRQLGHEDQARAWCDKAVEWMDTNQSNHDGLRRLRAEATELLKIEQKKD
jgi:WD40 repeat protein